MLERLSDKLESGISDMKSPVAEAWNIWKVRKILNRAVYEDLLAKINDLNTVLKTLIDQSDHREDTRKKRQTWHYLLRRYQKARKHAQGLFKTMTGVTYWRCQCKEQHCVHLQLQTNPLERGEDHYGRDIDGQSQFRMIFSNTKEADTTCLWTWTEVAFEPWQVEEIVKLASLSLHEDSKPLPQRKSKVQFDIPIVEDIKPMGKSNEGPPIQDLCSSLCAACSNDARRECLGSISNELDASIKYMMHAVKTLPKPLPQRPLSEILSQISQQDRLHIATGLACGVIQFYDNWLKAWWDSSDVFFTAASDGKNILLDKLYLSWSLSATDAIQGPRTGTKSSSRGNNRLLPLGLVW